MNTDLISNPFKTSPEEEARLKEQAKNFPVTRLPYGGERRYLKFDRRTHAPFRGALSARLKGGGLSWSDYQNGMHMQARATAHEMRLLYTPEFSASDNLLRLALAQQAYTYILSSWGGVREFFGGSRRVPQELVENRELLEKLSVKATSLWRERGIHSIADYRHLILCEQFGGYLAFRARIAYMAWREAKDATTIANELGIPSSTDVIRQILCRICWTARKLGLQTFTPHPSCHTHVWKLDYDQKCREILKYPEPSWKSRMSIEEAVDILVAA